MSGRRILEETVWELRRTVMSEAREASAFGLDVRRLPSESTAQCLQSLAPHIDVAGGRFTT